MVRRTEQDRWTVVTWYEEGLSVADICYKTGFDRRFVKRWVEKHEAGESIEDAKRSGRPRKRSTRLEAMIERKMRGKRRRSSRVIARDLKRHKITDISYSTVQRAAHNRGLRPYRRPLTSRLTPKQQQERLKFAKANLNKDWSRVVFSDEHRFKRFKGGNRAHDQVWAKSPTEVPGKEVERWGLTLDVWAGINGRGKTRLFIYQGDLKAPDYQHILQQALVPAAAEWFGNETEGWELQQDRATCHTAKSTMHFLEHNDIAVVEGWPPKGDDINPMENLWATLDEWLDNKKFNNLESMRRAVQAVWKKVDNQLLSNLINSVPDRLRRIVKAKGGSIKSVH